MGLQWGNVVFKVAVRRFRSRSRSCLSCSMFVRTFMTPPCVTHTQIHTHTTQITPQEWQSRSDQISTIRRRSSWQGGHSKARNQVLLLRFAEPAQDSITISRCHGDLSFHLGLAGSNCMHQSMDHHGSIHLYWIYCIALSANLETTIYHICGSNWWTLLLSAVYVF